MVKQLAVVQRPLPLRKSVVLHRRNGVGNFINRGVQRVKLAYFLSLSRTNKKSEKMLFIFDEPTTGLHFYDVEKLLKSFDALLAAGHSLIVVEHNPDVIRSADWIIDLGPDAGDRGGEVVFEGTPEDLLKADTFTARYI